MTLNVTWPPYFLVVMNMIPYQEGVLFTSGPSMFEITHILCISR